MDDQTRLRGVTAALGAVFALVVSSCGNGSATAPEATVLAGGPEAPVTTTTTTPAPRQTEPVSALPDLSARPLALADLEAMLPAGDTGAGAVPRETTTRGNDGLIAAAVLDPADEERDLTRYGRVTGIAARYPQATGEAHVWIDLLADAEAAHGYLQDAAGDIAKGYSGGHDPGLTATDTAEFAVGGLGDESIGMILTLGGGDTETAVLFRSGRLVAFVAIVHPDDSDQRVAVQYRAEEVAEQIRTTLLGLPMQAAAEIPPYRFEYRLEAAAGSGAWTVDAGGRVDGTDLSCRVRLDGPGTTIDRDLLLVGGRLWQREHGEAEYVATGGANLQARGLLSLCPPWPLDAATAGLEVPAASEPAAHTVNGVRALGYRADTAGLAGALGVSLPGVSTEAFHYWVGEDTPWVIEVDLVVTGPAGSLAPLLPPAITASGPLTLNARHRVLDLGKDQGSILAP